MGITAKRGMPKGGVKERSPWTDRVAKLPSWVSLMALSKAAGLEPQFLGSVKIGAKKLSPREAKAVIKELNKLDAAMGYVQGELFEI